MLHSNFLLSLLVSATFASAATLSATATAISLGSSSCNSSQTLQVSSSGGGASPIAFTVGVNYLSNDSNGNWLYASIANSGTTSTGTTFQSSTGVTDAGVHLTVGLNRSLGAVPDTAQVVLIDSGNPSDTVAITVSYSQNSNCGGNTGTVTNGFLTISPGNLSLTAPTNGQQSSGIAIQNMTGAGMTFGYGVSPSGSWLSASANATVIAADGSVPLNVTADATKTAGPGTYNGFLTITPQSGFGSPLNIPITFVVTSGGGSGGGPGTLTINGATATSYTTAFTYVVPTAPGSQCVTIQDTAAGASSYTTQATTSSGGNWLLANNQITTTTVQLLAPQYGACVNLQLSNVATTLSSGAYQGSVLITSSSGSQATISVNLYVSAGMAPGITVVPGPIFSFGNVAPNSNVIQQQVFAVSASPGYVLGIASLQNGANGFSISSPLASNNTETFTVTSNSTGLITGVYSTTVTITSTLNNSTNTTTITIVLPVGQGGTTVGSGNTTVAPTALAFQQQQGSSFWTGGQEAQQLVVTGAQGTQWSASIVYAGGASNWLNLDTGNSGTFGSGPTTLSVDLFNAVSGLAPSSIPYQATINIATTNGSYSVAVSLLVTAPNSPVLLGLPSSATFDATTGTNVPNQTVQIVGSDNTTSATNPPILAGTPSAPWLSASTSGNTMTISVNAAGQTTGVYSATIPVTASAYANPINYPVILVVNGGGTPPGPLTLSSSSLSYNNVTTQTSQNLGVTASSATNFTASTSETSCTSQTWLSITNGSNFTASTSNTRVQVSVNPSGIANGTTCSGVVNLNTSSATQSVSVAMTVGTTAGGNVSVSATSLNFNYTQNQTVPAALYVSIVNAISGTASIPFNVTTAETSGTSVNWLQVNATSSTTPLNTPGLGVSIAPGSLSPGQYTGTVTITPNGGTPQAIGVTLTIGPLPSLVIVESHAGNFVQGQTAATYTVTVSNDASSVSTSQTVTVQELVPAGLTLVSLSGSGWTCPANGTTCSRSDLLSPGGNYSAITVTVNVANNAAPSVTNRVNVSYNGWTAANASDPTTVLSPCALTSDATAGVPDIQKAIAEALGVNQPTDDLNLDGAINSVDVQAVVTAALGTGCFAGGH